MPHFRYDWDSSVTIAENPKVAIPSSLLDKATRAYRQVAQKAAWLQEKPLRRRLAVGIAGAAVLGALGGLALLAGPSHDDPVTVASAQPPAVEDAPAVDEATSSVEQTAETAAQPTDTAAQPASAPAPQAAAPAPASTSPAPAIASAAPAQPQMSDPQPAPAATMLETHDERWARTDEPQAEHPSSPEPARAIPESATAEPDVADAPSSDHSTTGSIVPVAPAPKPAPVKPVAAKPAAAKPVKPKPATAKTESASAPTKSAAADPVTGGAKVNSAVKMRATPDNDADVVTVVPGNASVNVISCKGWCKVSYGGKEGYIFKRFLNQEG
jgi:hypothetical protein